MGKQAGAPAELQIFFDLSGDPVRICDGSRAVKLATGLRAARDAKKLRIGREAGRPVGGPRARRASAVRTGRAGGLFKDVSTWRYRA
jgi:hypothetical protein